MKMTVQQKLTTQIGLISGWITLFGIVTLQELTIDLKAMMEQIPNCKILGVNFERQESGRSGTFIAVNENKYEVLKVNYIDLYGVMLQKLHNAPRETTFQILRLMHLPHILVKAKLLQKGTNKKLTLYSYKGPVYTLGDKCFLFNVINEIISKSDGTNKIIVGDLNVTPYSEESRHLSGLLQFKTFQGKQEMLNVHVPEKETCFDPRKKTREIYDFALSNGIVKIQTIDLGFYTEQNPSDHLPIYMEMLENLEDTSMNTELEALTEDT